MIDDNLYKSWDGLECISYNCMARGITFDLSQYILLESQRKHYAIIVETLHQLKANKKIIREEEKKLKISYQNLKQFKSNIPNIIYDINYIKNKKKILLLT